MVKLSEGTVHKLPADLKKQLTKFSKARAAWETLTPLARNEFICWVQDPKTEETRANHVERTVVDLMQGKRRPCCWTGCPHRRDKPLSTTQKWVFGKKKK